MTNYIDEVKTAISLYENPNKTCLRCAVRLPKCNAESVSFTTQEPVKNWYSVLKSRGKIIAVLVAPPPERTREVHIINVAANDHTGKRHLAKWVAMKERTYETIIPIYNIG